MVWLKQHCILAPATSRHHLTRLGIRNYDIVYDYEVLSSPHMCSRYLLVVSERAVNLHSSAHSSKLKYDLSDLTVIYHYQVILSLEK